MVLIYLLVNLPTKQLRQPIEQQVDNIVKGKQNQLVFTVHDFMMTSYPNLVEALGILMMDIALGTKPNGIRP